MFCKLNIHARKYTVGRAIPKEKKGVNFFYVVPPPKSKKSSKLTIIDRTGEKEIKITLSGRDVRTLLQIINTGREIMNNS